MRKNIHGINLDAIKPGDTVTITAVVAAWRNGEGFSNNGNVVLRGAALGATGPVYSAFVDPALITGHTPKPREVKVGDRLKTDPNSTYIFTIVAVEGDDVVYTYRDSNGKLMARQNSQRNWHGYVDA